MKRRQILVLYTGICEQSLYLPYLCTSGLMMLRTSLHAPNELSMHFPIETCS